MSDFFDKLLEKLFTAAALIYMALFFYLVTFVVIRALFRIFIVTPYHFYQELRYGHSNEASLNYFGEMFLLGAFVAMLLFFPFPYKISKLYTFDIPGVIICTAITGNQNKCLETITWPYGPELMGVDNTPPVRNPYVDLAPKDNKINPAPTEEYNKIDENNTIAGGYLHDPNEPIPEKYREAFEEYKKRNQ